MIAIGIGIFAILIVFWFLFGKNIVENLKQKRDRKFEQEQERIAFNAGYASEKIKIANEQGKEKARNESNNTRSLETKTTDVLNTAPKKQKFETKKMPVCVEHNFIGKNWLDYARHIRKFHK